jgi:hypothetical protein
MTDEQMQSGENVAAEIVDGRVVVNNATENVAVTEQEEVQVDNDNTEAEIEESSIEEDVASESEEEDEEEVASEAKPKKKGGFIKKLEAKEAEIEYWKQQAIKASKESSPEDAPSKPSGDAKPDISEFDDYETFQEALVEWKVEQKLMESNAQAQKKAIEDNFKVQVKEAQKKYDDFQDVVSVLDNKVSKEFFEESIKADNAAEIAYHLGQNYEQYSDILLSNNPAQINRLLGRLEAQLSQPKPESIPEKKPVKVTSAPAPITPLKGTVTITKDYGKMSADEYFKEVTLKRNN